MPQRPFTPDQGYLLPPDPDEWLAPDHPIRFVRAFVETLPPQVWTKLGVEDPAERGAARYDPKLLLSAWLAGFMVGIRSSRGIELACKEHLPFRYLLAGQTPDHNTLWRFYEQHRERLRVVLQETIWTAIHLELVDLVLQAVDGTKIRANARKNRTLTPEELEALSKRLEEAIADLEAQNVGEESRPPELPARLRSMAVLREAVAAAQQQIRAQGSRLVNLTDPEARMLHTPTGKAPAYNAQAVVAALDPERAGRRGRIVLAAAVVQEGTDNHLLAQMIAAAAVEQTPVPVTVADAGYHSGQPLADCAAAGYAVVIPESTPAAQRSGPYHHDRFGYDPTTDTVTCPQGQTLRHFTTRQDGSRRYRGEAAVCAACPARAACCSSGSGQPRTIRLGPHDARLREHRHWMASEEATTLSARRKGLIEPVFGIIKERMDGRRWHLRGLAQVQAEWTLLAIAFNLRTLAKVWAGGAETAMPTSPSLTGAGG